MAMTYQQVVVLYNGPDFGFETAQDIGRWYHEHGIPYQVLRRWKWYEKNYAWFRDLMDRGCHERQHLVKLARYMIRNHKWDWRQLTQEDFNILKLPGLTIKMVEHYGFHIPDLVFRIRKLNGFDLCGGHVEHCLSEVTLLAEAMNVKLNIIHQWTY